MSLILYAIAAVLAVVFGTLLYWRFLENLAHARFLRREEQELLRLLRASREEPPERAEAVLRSAISARHDLAQGALYGLERLAARDDPHDGEAKACTAAIRCSLLDQISEMRRLLELWEHLSPVDICRNFETWAQEQLATTVRELQQRGFLPIPLRVAAA